MKTLRYNNNNAEFNVELRQRIKNYFKSENILQYGNTQIFIKTFLMSALYITPYIFIVTGLYTSALWILVSFFIMGIGMSGLGMVTMHDANHGSFSRSKLINKIFGRSLYLLGGFPANWQIQHNKLHHGFTNINGYDEDIEPNGILRFSPHQPCKKIHRYQYIYAWFFYSLMTISWVTIKDFKRLVKYRNIGEISYENKEYQKLFFKLILSKIVYIGFILVVPIILFPNNWVWLICGFGVMHMTGGLILSTIFQTAHVVPTSDYPLPTENQEIESNWSIHQLYTTSDFSPKSRIFSWLIGGLNYQVVHHLFPNVSHIHYRNIAPIVKNTAIKYGLPYYVNRNFFVAIYEHIKMLKKLGIKTA